MEWINPHAWIHMEVKATDGKVTQVDDRSRGAERHASARVQSGFLPIGTEILVEGFMAKDGANRANGSSITYPDGKKLFIGSQGTGAPVEQ